MIILVYFLRRNAERERERGRAAATRHPGDHGDGPYSSRLEMMLSVVHKTYQVCLFVFVIAFCMHVYLYHTFSVNLAAAAAAVCVMRQLLCAGLLLCISSGWVYVGGKDDCLSVVSWLCGYDSQPGSTSYVCICTASTMYSSTSTAVWYDMYFEYEIPTLLSR